MFDPLLGTSESVYLGTGEGNTWDTKDERTQRDPHDDVSHFKSLWKKWTTLLDKGQDL